MSKNFNSKITLFVFLLVVSTLLIFFNSAGYLNGVKGFVVYAINPAQKIFQAPSNKINSLFYTIKNINKFKEKNLDLQKENLDLIYENSLLKETQKENEILREQLRFSNDICLNEECINWKMGQVIGRNSDNYGEYLIIDLGKRQGVRENLAVTVSRGTLIGKITEVFNNSARVMLITNPESTVNSITKTTRANGVTKGSYATGVKLEMINQNERIFEDDIVITSGLEKEIPKGLIIGKIYSIEESANEIFKQANIDLFADFGYIEKVFVAEKNSK
ncbi:rod shape-determining protein MreC [Candidatus Parcubacteria bacterium]|nr:rod shape-determining protein MreC [Candidatus Parcubacteria bacterium]